MPIDKRNRLDENPFEYRISKDRKVFISWQGKAVSTLAGKKAEKFIAAAQTAGDFEIQLLLAKATGHFKHGNER
ncbi:MULTISPECIES: hypothetical protein [unclassified Paenibacillus]|uniref:hypothetical protein n=1 Tax=unclassified Paenibacillus TaxID=185978 RepID=UPI000954ECF7|nr:MULTISPECIES: hypothetical protein [unclassified Paenibacillus]ASS64795.1 hypothetical protein CIC07_00735 [Paenibacillus sp. RUD330]SIR05725.1 hypothetical protein SAMN05880555_2912 [Paenibacillus sp. RU4X]SIR29665.1 hypothetical protein SAMN05880570_3087 [Paenibacillus sp. RU4T]